MMSPFADAEKMTGAGGLIGAAAGTLVAATVAYAAKLPIAELPLWQYIAFGLFTGAGPGALLGDYIEERRSRTRV